MRPRVLRSNQPPGPPPPEDPLLRGVLRDRETRLRIQPAEVTGPGWAADFPLDPAPETEAPEPPEHDAERLQALRATWEAEAEARLEAAVAEARAEGYAAGRTDAEAEAAAAQTAQQAAFQDAVARLQALWEDGLKQIEPSLVGLAVGIAEAVLGAPLPEAARESAAAALTTAVERLAGHPPLTIRLHPVDHLHLQERGLTDALAAAHPSLRWLPDPSFDEGDWAVDAADAAVRHVRAELLHDLRLRLGLVPDGAEPEATP